MDIGNCVRGVMNKEGWKDIIARYRAATGLVHDREQLAGRLRQLKGHGDSVISFATPLDWDVQVMELLWPLINGGMIILR
jgi:hypothetical protein